MIKGKDIKKKTSTVTLGTTYDINKNLVQQYEKELSTSEIEDRKNLLVNFIKQQNDTIFMMLCHEQRDYTIFNVKDGNNPQINEIIECLVNRGKIVGIDKTKDEQAIEIWLIINNEAFCYYLFSFGKAVVYI